MPGATVKFYFHDPSAVQFVTTDTCVYEIKCSGGKRYLEVFAFCVNVKWAHSGAFFLAYEWVENSTGWWAQSIGFIDSLNSSRAISWLSIARSEWMDKWRLSSNSDTLARRNACMGVCVYLVVRSIVWICMNGWFYITVSFSYFKLLYHSNCAFYLHMTVVSAWLCACRLFLFMRFFFTMVCFNVYNYKIYK